MWYLTPLSDTNSFWHRRHLYFPATKFPCFKEKSITGKLRNTYLGHMQGLLLIKRRDSTSAKVRRKKIQNSNMFKKNSSGRLSPLYIYPNAILYKNLPPPQHNPKSSYFYYVTCHIFLSSLVHFQGSLDSSPKIIKFLNFTKGTKV